MVHVKRELFLLKESELSLKHQVHVFDKNMCKKIFFLDNFSSSSRS